MASKPFRFHQPFGVVEQTFKVALETDLEEEMFPELLKSGLNMFSKESQRNWSLMTWCLLLGKVRFFHQLLESEEARNPAELLVLKQEISDTLNPQSPSYLKEAPEIRDLLASVLPRLDTFIERAHIDNNTASSVTLKSATRL